MSSLDVGDNELSGALLAAKMAEQTLDAIPEIPATMVAIFLGDSQCTVIIFIIMCKLVIIVLSLQSLGALL